MWLFSNIETDAAYWTQLGQQLLFDELAKQRINSQAKNIILFLGDGQYICAGPYSAAFKIQFYFGRYVNLNCNSCTNL